MVQPCLKELSFSKKNFSSIHIDFLRVKFQWWSCARSSSRNVPVYFQALDMCMRAGDNWSPSYIQSLREWSTTSLRGLWTVDWKILATSTLASRCRHRYVVVLTATVVEYRIPCLIRVDNCFWWDPALSRCRVTHYVIGNFPNFSTATAKIPIVSRTTCPRYTKSFFRSPVDPRENRSVFLPICRVRLKINIVTMYNFSFAAKIDVPIILPVYGRFVLTRSRWRARSSHPFSGWAHHQ